MLNKNKYRDFLLRKMEIRTPTIAVAGSIALTTAPIETQIQKDNSRHFFKRTLAISSAICGALILVLAVPFTLKAIQDANSSPWIMSVGERNYMAARIYNEAVKGDESIPYANENTTNINFSLSDFKYFSISILDSFYLQTSFEESLAPFFDESFVNEKVGTIFALLDVLCESEFRNSVQCNYIMPMMILQFGDKTSGFLGGPNAPREDFDNTPTFQDSYFQMNGLHFGSGNFLTKNEIIYLDGMDLYQFDLSGNDNEGFDFSCYISKKTGGTTPIPCSLDNDSYKPMGKEVTIDLLNQTKEVKKDGSATITAIDKTNWTLSVESTTLPTLKTVKFTQLVTNSTTYEFDPDGILGVGDEIYFSYYERYQGYEPVNLSIYSITIKK